MISKRKEPYAIIRPIGFAGKGGGVTLPGAYAGKRGAMKYIHQDGRVTAELKKGQREWNIRFSAENMQYNIIKDSEQDDFCDSLVEYFMEHPLVSKHGEKKKTGSKFEIEIVRDTKKKKEDSVNDIMKAMVTIKGMKDDEVKDVLYFFGNNPEGMDSSDMFLHLCDLNSGVFADKEKRDLFISRYVDAKGKDVILETQIQIDINKALASGYLDERGGVLYFESRTLGSTPESKIAYFIDNPSDYDNMRKSLSDNGYIKSAVKAVAQAKKEVDIRESIASMEAETAGYEEEEEDSYMSPSAPASSAEIPKPKPAKQGRPRKKR